jgi:hypothetical protein
MHKILPFALLFICASAHAVESLPNAPTPITVPVFHRVDWSISATLVATHIGDYLSTRQALKVPTRAREAVLPENLVRSQVGFAAYEAATAGLEIYAQYELTRHGHRRIARCAQLVNIGFTVRTVESNYRLNWTAPNLSNPRLRPFTPR